MAKIAAIKNVLSPISEAKIIDAERRNPSSVREIIFIRLKSNTRVLFSLERISNCGVTKVAHERRVHIHHIARKSRALLSKSRRSLSLIKRSAFFSSSRGSLNGSFKNGSSSRKAGKEEAEEKSLTRVVFPAGRKRRHF